MRSGLRFLSGFCETRKDPEFASPGLPGAHVRNLQLNYSGWKQSRGQERASANSKN